MARTLAGIYDLQHDPKHHERMVFASPASGEPVALSYLVPESQDDLPRRRAALETVAQSCHGMLGRTPDYVNIQVTATRQLADLFDAATNGSLTTSALITSTSERTTSASPTPSAIRR